MSLTTKPQQQHSRMSECRIALERECSSQLWLRSTCCTLLLLLVVLEGVDISDSSRRWKDKLVTEQDRRRNDDKLMTEKDRRRRNDVLMARMEKCIIRLVDMGKAIGKSSKVKNVMPY